MNKWLQGFACRVHISWWMFAIAGFATVLIALFYSEFAGDKSCNESGKKS